MEITFTNMLLIIIAPLAAIAVLMLFIHPLYQSLFDRDTAIKKQMAQEQQKFKDRYKVELNQFKKNVDAGFDLHNESERVRTELNTIRGEYMRSSRSLFKQLVRVHIEDSGFTDTIKEWKIEGWRSAHMYVGSIMLTPAMLVFLAATGLDMKILTLMGLSETSPFQYPLLTYLVLPVGGVWLAFRGFASYHNISTLRIALLLNVCYALSIAYAGIVSKPN